MTKKEILVSQIIKCTRMRNQWNQWGIFHQAVKKEKRRNKARKIRWPHLHKTPYSALNWLRHLSPWGHESWPMKQHQPLCIQRPFPWKLYCFFPSIIQINCQGYKFPISTLLTTKETMLPLPNHLAERFLHQMLRQYAMTQSAFQTSYIILINIGGVKLLCNN